MTAEGDSRYRDGRYLAEHPTWHSEDSEWKASQILELLRRNRLAPAEVCEVGCGAGWILWSLKQHMPPEVRFYGYEISPEAHQLAGALADDRLEFFLADLLEEEVHYPAICCIDVVEHVEDYLGFLRRLRPKGEHKIFHIPLEISVERLLRRDGFVSVRRRYGHLHHFTRSTALASLKDAGYRILDWFYTPSELVLPVKSPGQALARWPRRLVYALHKGLAARTTGGVSIMILAA